MKLKILLLLAFSLMGMPFVQTFGASVTVTAEGILTDYSDPEGLLPFPEPAPGATFQLQFTYDSNSLDSDLTNLNRGRYVNAISDFELVIAGQIIGILEEQNITMHNDRDSGGGILEDAWVAYTQTRTTTGEPDQETILYERLFFSLVEQSFEGSPLALSSDALVAPDWPSTWDFGQIWYRFDRQIFDGPTYSFDSNIAFAGADIASVSFVTAVPIPATAWLFCSGLGLLGLVRRKKLALG